MLLPYKEHGRLLATLILQLLKKNIISKQKIRKTQLELPEKSKKLEDSFTTQQRLRCTNSSDQVKKNLSFKRRKLKKERKRLLKVLHLNLTRKKLIL